MRRLVAACAAVVAAGVGFAPAPPADPTVTVGTAAPAHQATAASSTTSATPRSIVVLDADVHDVPSTARAMLAPLGLVPAHLYRHALRGFAVEASPAQLAGLEDHPDVAYVEADRAVHTAGQTVPHGVRRVDAVAAARIGRGAAVPLDIAILDTGIAAHDDLRVVERLDCTDSSIEPSVDWVNHVLLGTCKQGGADADGHGTQVAGVAAARDDGRGVVGVAPGARLWSIRVIRNTDGGALSDVVAGVDEVARNADAIEVANISLVAEGRSRAMDDAVGGAVDAGAVVVVAAGNASEDANGTTPANSPGAITVSAVTDLDGRPGGLRRGRCHGRDDRFATYSNHGAVVDIAAPGSCILSTARDGRTAVSSGTSMAAPHVAGAAALRIHQHGYERGARRAGRVLDDLLATSARENSACGYIGSPSDERLLDLRRGC